MSIYDGKYRQKLCNFITYFKNILHTAKSSNQLKAYLGVFAIENKYSIYFTNV